MDGMMTYLMNAQISEQNGRGCIASAPVPQLLPKSVPLEEKDSRVADAFLTKDAAA